MDSALVSHARVFVDSRAAALAEAGDILIPIAEGIFDETHIAGELGEVVLGAVPGRTSDTEITIFKSVGMAVEDVAAAHLAYVKAAERGLGRGFVL
jgi:ornithine cyclodeaminase/alanine dehydrogenase-like protein (mu-crystallin family)